MRSVPLLSAGLLLAVCAAAPAAARVRVAVDLSSQTMQVDGSGGHYVWPISSARSGFSTPHGFYAPTSLQRMHYSRKYHMSPMPYSIFFRGGYAIHGTYSVRDLGRPASHGCIRLAPANAARLFAMVEAEGAGISISGSPPQDRPSYARATFSRQRARGFGDAYEGSPYAGYSGPTGGSGYGYGYAPAPDSYGYGYGYGGPLGY